MAAVPSGPPCCAYDQPSPPTRSPPPLVHEVLDQRHVPRRRTPPAAVQSLRYHSTAAHFRSASRVSGRVVCSTQPRRSMNVAHPLHPRDLGEGALPRQDRDFVRAALLRLERREPGQRVLREQQVVAAVGDLVVERQRVLRVDDDAPPPELARGGEDARRGRPVDSWPCASGSRPSERQRVLPVADRRRRHRARARTGCPAAPGSC